MQHRPEEGSNKVASPEVRVAVRSVRSTPLGIPRSQDDRNHDFERRGEAPLTLTPVSCGTEREAVPEGAPDVISTGRRHPGGQGARPQLATLLEP